jgi:mono/diheme cytochrome c family protein
MSAFHRRWSAMLLFAFFTLCAQSLLDDSARAASPDANGYVGNQACAGCHSAIYDSYQKTSMANASGPALNNLIPADFFHQRSGVRYRIYQENSSVWLSFERANDPGVSATSCITSDLDGAGEVISLL